MKSAPDTILPLRLTPTEVCLLLEDCDSHPMQFHLRLRFGGSLQHDPLQDALQATLARHPLLTCVVAPTGNQRWDWVPPLAGSQPRVDWTADEPGDGLPAAAPLDIRRAPGVRVSVVEGASVSDLVFQFHHVSCDALGAVDFVGDLLTAYANGVSPDQQYRPKRLDLGRLRRRATYGLSRWQRLKWMLQHAPDLPRLRRFYKARPVSVVPHQPPLDQPPPPAFPECCFHHFLPTESVAIQRYAKQVGSTLNNLLTRDLFLALHDWRGRHNLVNDADMLRVAVPLSMRTVGDRQLPAANACSIACLDRSTFELQQEASRLLRGIDDQVQAIKDSRLDLLFPMALRLLQFFPGELGKGLRRKRFFGSVILTNIGPALATCHLPRRNGKLAVGDLSLEAVEFLPVLRPHQVVTFAVSIYAGAITLGMHYDSRVVERQKAREILNCYIDRVRANIVNSRAHGPGVHVTRS